MPASLPRPRIAPPAAPPIEISKSVRNALLGTTLVGLLAHAWSYGFLTDDAFISFRYARNLAHGYGLVFNPGFERVEGYTNFLWVVLLSGLDRLGIPPELAAQVLSGLATVALWGLVAAFSLRLAAGGRAAWAALVAPTALALTRSVAVWSTGGLETRLFETLLVGGAVRWTIEIESWTREGPSRRVIAPWLFALAALTRPDGLMPALAAGALGALWLARDRRLDARFARAWLPFALLVGGLLAFRRIYYGEWVPNTYYAKVGGELWWSSGVSYLVAFALEYALWLWLPLAILGAVALTRRGRGFFPALAAAMLVPYVLALAAIGGDYFEYRPLDLTFPFLFLLAAEGIRALATAPVGRTLAPLVLVAGLIGLWELPAQSRRQFPDLDTVGFPGRMLDGPGAGRAFLDPPRGPYRLPGLSLLARAHRDRLRDLTYHFVGVRQEELARFARSVVPEGRRLRALIEDGRVPRDLYVAMGAVGAIPYESDLRVLDALGLTDAAVARSGSYAGAAERLMAHDRRLRWEDAVARGVDLVAVDAHLLLRVDSDALLSRLRESATFGDSVYAADVGDGYYLVGQLPQGPARAAARMPRLALQKLDDPDFVESFMGRAIAAWRDSLAARPADPHARLRLAWLLLAHTEYAEARELYRAVAAQRPDELEAWDQLAWCELRLGDIDAARAALARAISVAEAMGAPADAERLRTRLAELSAIPG